MNNLIMMGQQTPEVLADKFRDVFSSAYGPDWTCADCYVSAMNFQDENGKPYPMAFILSGPQKAGGVYSMITHAINEGVANVGFSLSA